MNDNGVRYSLLAVVVAGRRVLPVNALLPLLAVLFAAPPVSGQMTAAGSPSSVPVTIAEDDQPASPNPSVPQNVTVTPGNGKLTITWQAPSSWGIWPAGGIRFQWKFTADSSWWRLVRVGSCCDDVASPLETSYEFTGQYSDFSTSSGAMVVTNGVSYDLRMFAYSQKPGTDGFHYSHYRYSNYVTVSNNIPAPPAPTVMVFFERPSYVAAEGGAGAGVTVRLSRPPAQAVTVPLTATPHGGATAVDYTGVPASVTFGLADTMRTFTVTALADDDDDDGESVVLGFGALPTSVIAGSPTSATVTVADAGGPGFEGDLDAGLPQPVRAVHLVELRLRVDALRRAHGLAAFARTDAVIEPGVTPVRAVHLTELRTALDEVYDATGRVRPLYADASIRAGATAIRAAHFLELRNAIVTLENPDG